MLPVLLLAMEHAHAQLDQRSLGDQIAAEDAVFLGLPRHGHGKGGRLNTQQFLEDRPRIREPVEVRGLYRAITQHVLGFPLEHFTHIRSPGQAIDAVDKHRRRTLDRGDHETVCLIADVVVARKGLSELLLICRPDEVGNEIVAAVGLASGFPDCLVHHVVQRADGKAGVPVPGQWQPLEARRERKVTERQIPFQGPNSIAQEFRGGLHAASDPGVEQDAHREALHFVSGLDVLLEAPPLLGREQVLDDHVGAGGQPLLFESRRDHLAQSPMIFAVAPGQAGGLHDAIRLLGVERPKGRLLNDEYLLDEVGVKNGAALHGRKLEGDDLAVIPVESLQESWKLEHPPTKVAKSATCRSWGDGQFLTPSRRSAH